MNSKFKLLAKDTLLFAIGSIGSKVCLFLMVPLYTNYLSTAEYGVADLVFTYAQFFIPILTCMIYDAVLRFGSSKQEDLSNVAICGITTCVLSCLISFLLIPVFRKSSNIGEWAGYLSFYICLSCFYQLLINYLKVKNKNGKYALVGIINTFFLAGANVLFIAELHLGIKGYLLSNIIGTFIAVIFALLWSSIFTDVQGGHLDIILWKRMLSYSWPLIFNNIAWWVINSSDKLMIKQMIGDDSLGLYTTAAKIPSVINVIIGIFSSAWGLASIKEVENGSDSSFSSSVLKYYSLIVFGSATFIIMIVKPFMSVYVGVNFVSAWRLTPLLVVAAVFYALSTYYASIYSAVKKTKNSMWTTILCAVVNVIVNYIGIKIMGVYGAAIGTLISFLTLMVTRIIDVGKFLDLSINYYKLIINSILLFAVALLITFDIFVPWIDIIAFICFVLLNFGEIKVVIDTICNTYRKLLTRK